MGGFREDAEYTFDEAPVWSVIYSESGNASGRWHLYGSRKRFHRALNHALFQDGRPF
jgi:hypothetical protein